MEIRDTVSRVQSMVTKQLLLVKSEEEDTFIYMLRKYFVWIL